MIEISPEILNVLLRNKGMASITQLSIETGINRLTLANILNGKRQFVRKETYMKLTEWIACINKN